MVNEVSLTMRLALVLFFISPLVALSQVPGVVHDKVSCSKDTDHTYALYVPKKGNAAERGIILLFDPGARGRLPVEKYIAIAEEYNFILACSNQSRNGPFQESLHAGNVLLEDVRKRFNLPTNVVFTSGFSGGARAAVQMAIEQQTVLGVIACGAAFPAPNAITLRRPVPFVEVIGRLDMNYQEALRANKYLLSESLPGHLILFDGGHDWPPAQEFGSALRWQLLRMKRLSPEQIQLDQKDRLTAVDHNVDVGRFFEALLMFSELKADYPNLKTSTKLESESLAKKIKAGLKDFERASDLESRMQEQISYAFRAHIANAAPDSAYHEDFWKKTLAECKKLQSSDHVERSNVGARLIDFGWRMCAEQSFVFMNYEQYRQSAMSARIWTVLQPDNPNAPLQAAKAFAHQKRKKDAVAYLKLAVARGASDEQLKDPILGKYVALAKTVDR